MTIQAHLLQPEQSRFLQWEFCTGGVPLLHFTAAGCVCKPQQLTLEVSQVLKETSLSPHHQEHCPPLAEVLSKGCGSPCVPQAPHRPHSLFPGECPRQCDNSPCAQEAPSCCGGFQPEPHSNSQSPQEQMEKDRLFFCKTTREL